ncbi:hypothetical protein CPAR01_13780 [Colletotrichum paranaense]|uniref:Uncharacterized protein n=1 Tax=Colletotrichum paranaense TaxID=1914294 RepID=A0ABQ9S4C0_9PEZI|nr:uncharacterized protein CPAR01_13780 [Colletotrichum paranaense]KAK1524832.1 hypothetical protein CPAR01_13780 [Colletotrichum paranaense]
MPFDPGDDRRPVTQDEEQYWESMRQLQEQDDENLDKEYLNNAKYYMARLTELNLEKNELERRALEVHRAITREHRHLEELNDRFQNTRKDMKIQREHHQRQLAVWFDEQRRKDNDERVSIAAAALAGAAPRRDSAHIEASHLSKVASAGLNGMNTNGEHRNGAAVTIPSHVRPNQPPLTMIIDASGRTVGPVNRLVSSNRIVIYLSSLPQKRPVQLRDGIIFSQDDMKAFGEAEDKWKGAIIQATGLVRKQSQQCAQCASGRGPFVQCIGLDMPEFQACGNCVWQSTNCCDVPPSINQTPPTRGFKALNAQDVYNERAANGSFTNGTATPVGHSRPGSRDKSFAEGSTATDETEEDMTPITKANLLLKHDGKVFTHPECMAGVPVNKIDQTHEYWDPAWPDIVPTIEPTLQSWRDKLQTALEKGQTSMKFQLGRQVNRGETILKFLSDADFCPYQLVGKKYMMTRLVSYDTIFRLADTLRTLEGFKTLDITPLEWLRQRLQEIIILDGPDFNLAKTIHDFYHDSKYVALRLANGKKSIGRPSGMKMAPKDSPNSARGTPNNKKRKLFINEEYPLASQRPLAPTPTPQFQSQPQVHQMQPQMQTQVQPQVHPPVQPQPQPQPPPPPQPQSQLPPSQLQSRLSETPLSAPPTPELARQSKKLRTARIPGKLKDEDLHYDGFTDVDDYSGDHIGPHDWALNRIKSRLNSVSTGVTQYWHWIPDNGEQIFEHQVLAESDTLTWGIYAKPVNFHLELEHIQEMKWATDTSKVIVVCKDGVVISPDGKPRGDLLAEFKRDRTKRRFLVFCRKKGVELIKVEADVIQKAWDEYESPDVPAMPDSEIE